MQTEQHVKDARTHRTHTKKHTHTQTDRHPQAGPRWRTLLPGELLASGAGKCTTDPVQGLGFSVGFGVYSRDRRISDVLPSPLLRPKPLNQKKTLQPQSPFIIQKFCRNPLPPNPARALLGRELSDFGLPGFHRRACSNLFGIWVYRNKI